MPMTLTVPDLSARTTNEIELKPEKVKKWLEDLPVLNVADTSQKLYTTLSMYNRVDFDHGLRLQLLELFRSPISQMVHELSKQYLGLPLPLSDKHKSIAEQTRQFMQEMANGYKRVVLSLEAKSDRNSKKYVLAIQRAIRYLTEILIASYQTYSPYPPNIWKEIHLLFLQAEKSGITYSEADDPLNTAITKSSILHVYLQALLIGFSDPYHMPARTIDRINHYLDRWAPLAQLTQFTKAYNPTCQFLIDQEDDRVGIAYAADTLMKNSESYRLLNTVELARQIHTQLTLLMKGEAPPSEGLHERFFQESGQDLLKRLISAWGVNPQRAFRRSPPTQHQVQLAVGMELINYWINGGKKFVASSTFVGPMPQRTQIGTGAKKSTNAPLPGKELSTWFVEDEGAGGLSLSISGKIKIHVHVGDLIITRTPGDNNPWSVGVIRWVKSESSSNVSIGVQYLAPNAEPVVIKTMGEDKQESDFLPALLLQEIKPLKQPQTLITDCGIFKLGADVYMDNSYRLYKIAPTKLIESSEAFEQFTFNIQNV